MLSIEWNSIRLGGPAHEIATTSCTQKLFQGMQEHMRFRRNQRSIRYQGSRGYVDVEGQRGVYGPGGLWGLGVCPILGVQGVCSVSERDRKCGDLDSLCV